MTNINLRLLSQTNINPEQEVCTNITVYQISPRAILMPNKRFCTNINLGQIGGLY